MSTRRAAIVTGASSGIGLALAHMLGEEGYSLTVTARHAEELPPAVEKLRGAGFDLEAVAADFSNANCEQTVERVVTLHRGRFGRLDVLCNNAGAAVGTALPDVTAKRLDIQISTNLRQIVFFYRECVGLLRAAAEEHRNAHVINTSSILGKRGEAWLSVYSATKHAIVGWTQAMNQELGPYGIKSCALCPDLVDTPMSRVFASSVPADSMIETRDLAEMARAVLKLSPRCLVPEVILTTPAAGTRNASIGDISATAEVPEGQVT